MSQETWECFSITSQEWGSSFAVYLRSTPEPPPPARVSHFLAELLKHLFTLHSSHICIRDTDGSFKFCSTSGSKTHPAPETELFTLSSCLWGRARLMTSPRDLTSPPFSLGSHGLPALLLTSCPLWAGTPACLQGLPILHKPRLQEGGDGLV